MITTLALEYIARRMNELGYGNDYYIRFRHLVLKQGETIVIDAYKQLYIIADEAEGARIESIAGIFDLKENATNELIYEHQGEITITNYDEQKNNVKFIQVIPKHIKRKK